MALNAKLKRLVQDALKRTGDLRTYVTYVQQTPGPYDPVTDEISFVTVVHTDIPALLVKLSNEDLEWWPGDMIGQRALIAYNDLPITPDDSDHILVDGVKWSIYRTKGVPGGSLHNIYLRLP